jgi:ubiquinone/menaquinone biosynthesis C-methylase UbiE
VAQLHLLPEEVLIKTGPVDHADWNFRPILGSIQRSRFHLMIDLLEEHHFDRLLEVGYGSGVFMPELARRCRSLHGIDVHRHAESVSHSLRKLDLRASLLSGSAESMPFEDGFFDAVVAVSSFEFIPDLDRACREIRRVLTKTGVFFVVTPGHSQLVDLGLRLLTGQNARADYGKRRERVMPTLRRHFKIQRVRPLPSVSTAHFCLYKGLKLAKS